MQKPIVQRLLADIAMRQGNIGLAVTQLTQVIEYSPRNLHAFLQLAGLHIKEKQLSPAATIMRKALDIDPQRESERTVLTNYPLPENFLARYADFFKEAKVTGANRTLKYSSEGVIRFHVGEKKEAMKLFALALREDRFNHAALLYSAIIDLENKNYRAAKQKLQKSEKTSARGHTVTQLYTARAEIGLKDYSSAEKRLRRVLDDDPNANGAKFTLAQHLHKRGQTAEAIKMFEELVWEAPDYVPVKRLLAQIGE